MWILGLKGLKRVAVDSKGKGLQDSRTWMSTTRTKLTKGFLRVFSKNGRPGKLYFTFFFLFYQKSKHGIETAQVFSDHLFLSL